MFTRALLLLLIARKMASGGGAMLRVCYGEDIKSARCRFTMRAVSCRRLRSDMLRYRHATRCLCCRYFAAASRV